MEASPVPVPSRIDCHQSHSSGRGKVLASEEDVGRTVRVIAQSVLVNTIGENNLLKNSLIRFCALPDASSKVHDGRGVPWGCPASIRVVMASKVNVVVAFVFSSVVATVDSFMPKRRIPVSIAKTPVELDHDGPVVIPDLPGNTGRESLVGHC